jgi:hypothetical protein
LSRTRQRRVETVDLFYCSAGAEATRASSSSSGSFSRPEQGAYRSIANLQEWVALHRMAWESLVRQVAVTFSAEATPFADEHHELT